MGAPKLAPGRTEKRCPQCETVKPLDEFYRNKSSADGRHGYCKPCWDERAKGYNYDRCGREYHRNSHLKKTYGIDLDEYNRLFAFGDGRCWVCNQPETATHPRTGTVFNLAVDHDHVTGEVRGLLCFYCNTRIRSVGDDRQRLLDMAEYLTTGQPIRRAA